jgi:polysaccharide biosynthesis/export protein
MTLKQAFGYKSRSRGQKIVAALLSTCLARSVVPGFATAASKAGEIQKIEVQEEAKTITVTLHGVNIGKCQPVVLKDPQNRRLPILSLPFQNTKLDPKFQGTQPGLGSVLSVDAQQILEEPAPLTQILVSLAGDVHYRLKRNTAVIIIDVEKAGFSSEMPPETISGAPLPAARKPNTQVIQPGDLLFFSISPAEELSRDLIVDQNGKISLPLIGAVDVAGLNAETLARKLTGLMSKYVTNPRVDVLIKQFNSQQISLMGQVRNPGAYPYRANLRLLDVVSMAGGFLPGVNKSQIRVYRGTGPARKAVMVDVSDALKTGDVTKDFLLQPGDLIEIPKGVNPLTIFGNIDHGGNYDYYRDMRMLDLISLAQGFKDGANTGKLIIYRGTPPFQKVFKLKFTRVLEGKMDSNILLEPGDVIYVPTRPLWTYSAVATTITPLTTIILTVATVFLATKK